MLLFRLLLPLAVFISFLSPTLAATFDSDNYHIDMGNFNVTSGRKTSTNYELTDTVGQTSPGQYNSTGYIVKAGFQYINTIIPFTFTISDLSINLGTLSSGSFSDQTNTLTVSAGGSGGYQVLAQEIHPLRYNSNDLPDTTCDDNTCTEVLCRPWTQTDKYGFGLNAAGNDVNTTSGKFADSTYYCQFADNELAEAAQAVMARTSPTNSSTATITYRANPHPLQTAGSYETAISFTAVPKY